MFIRFVLRGLMALGLVGMSALPALAADGLDTGDTAWILSATALVLFMTLPGLALFYAGLVQSKNIISVLMHHFAIACLMSVLWVVAGYSLAFSGDGAWFGNLDNMFLAGIGIDSMAGTIPESLFAAFQMTFAIITPALVIGAYVERMKFAAVLIFSVLWLLFVYAPVTHWVWGGGIMAGWGVMDFAGGIVVHATAGTAALVCAVMVGKRRHFPQSQIPPHSPALTMIGASMLWVGWFGFNGGSALGAGGGAGMALLVTHIAAATASLVWMGIEWMRFGRPSLVGIVTGMVAGLATVTPASGFIGVPGGLILGLAGGFLRLLDRLKRFLQKVREFLVLGLGRGEVHHDILAKHLDLDIAAGDGVFQRLDHILGGVALAAVLVLLALLDVKVGLGDVGRLLRHVLGDRRRRGRAEIQRQDRRALGLLDNRDDPLHTEGILKRARNLLEFGNVELGE